MVNVGNGMLSGERILVTGPAGQIAAPLCAQLARDNEVWGIARFSAPGSRDEVEQMGVTTRVVDLATGDFGDLPRDFTYVLHLAAAIGPDTDYDQALRVNAEATGMLLAHCRDAKGALVMSTASVYKPNADPRHLYTETDPLGEAVLPSTPTYSVTKIAEEAVARYCARALNLPVTIARMNAAYSARGGLPAYHLDTIINGNAVVVRNDPCPYSPIHQDDINGQVAAMLAAASVPATIVNWAGDDVVGPHEWCAYFGELTGIEPKIVVQPVPGSQPGAAVDVTKRTSITGPCSVRWRDGFRRLYEARYPDGARGGMVQSGRGNPLPAAPVTPGPATTAPQTPKPPLPMLSVEEATQAAAAAGVREVLASTNVVRFALRNEKVGRILADVIEMAVMDGSLSARLREIAILRVGWRIGSVYEWSHHVPIARRAGLTDDELLAIRTSDARVLSPADLLAITVADEVLDANSVSPTTLASARALLGDGDELLELVAIPGSYRLIGSLLATFSIPLEAHVEPWAPNGKGPST